MAEFLRPPSVEEALAALRHDRAIAVAGGTQVALLLKSGLLDVDTMVWLGAIPELRRISAEGDRLLIGASVTLDELGRSDELRRLHPALIEAAAGIGNPRVRAAATLGGHLAHADPRQDLPPVLIVLDATVVIAGPGGSRKVPLGEFFAGFMSTALEPEELLVAIELPPPPAGRRTGYVRFAPRGDSDYAAVGVAATIVRSDGEVVQASLAIGAGAAWPQAVLAATTALLGRPGDAEVEIAARAVAEAANPSDDQRGSAAYKRAMAALWTRRLLNRLLG